MNPVRSLVVIEKTSRDIALLNNKRNKLAAKNMQSIFFAHNF